MADDDNYSPTDEEKLSSAQTQDVDLNDEDLIKVAKHRFAIAAQAESATRKEELEDIDFMVGDQWPTDIKAQRLLDQRPCLTINRLPQFVRQITNDQRQNRPSMKVNPADDVGTIETAKVLSGMIRHIEYASHADVAYDTAFEGSASSGLGYFRIITDYSDPMSFQQEIKIKQIKDRFSVYVDPYYEEPDGSDIQWGFVFEELSQEEFRAQWPDSKLSLMSDWVSLDSMSSSWVKQNSVRVAEYYYKTYEEEDLCLLSNGKVLKKKDLPKVLPDGLRITSERRSLIPKIKWAKINGVEVLEQTEILGEWIPIIPVIGEEYKRGGTKIYSGILRNAKDPQRMYNYWSSAETETIALAPKAPFIGAEGQFEGFEQKWKTANTKNHAFLEYKIKSSNGIQSPPPQRNVQEPPIQAITNARTLCIDDMKGTTGIYDAGLGKEVNHESGVAIQRRNNQSQTSNFHFIDNLSRSMRHAGRIILNWIPQVYSTSQAVRIIGEDGEITSAKINQIFQEGGEEKHHFLDSGRYDCTISTGPSFQTKRQEAVASMLDLARSLPQSMQMGLDLLVRNMDWPGASEIADRIKRTIPANIVGDDKNQKPLPPQIQAQMTQMGQMIKTLTAQNSEYIEQLRTKALELASKERIAAMEQKTQVTIELMKHDQKDAALIFQAEQDHIDRRLELLNIDQPIPNSGPPMPPAPPQQGAGMPGQGPQQQPPNQPGPGPQGAGPPGAM